MNSRFAYDIKAGDTIIGLDTPIGTAKLDNPILVISVMEHKRAIGSHYTIAGETLGKETFFTCADYDVFYVSEVSK